MIFNEQVFENAFISLCESELGYTHVYGYAVERDYNRFQFFLYLTLDSANVKNCIFTFASSKAAQPGLNQTELLSVDIALPSKKHLEDFENAVDPLMHNIASNSLQNRLLAQTRDSLLPKLMSGEMDISDISI